MTNAKNKPSPLSFLYKAFCLIVIGFFVIIGLAGLILPIIPGILFLVLAALLLAKISTRFDFLLKSSSTRRSWLRRWETVKGLSGPQRLKLSFWVCARAIVNGAESGARFLKSTLAKKRPVTTRQY